MAPLPLRALRLSHFEWGWAERREWLERMLKAVVVSRGRELLSERVEVVRARLMREGWTVVS